MSSVLDFLSLLTLAERVVTDPSPRRDSSLHFTFRRDKLAVSYRLRIEFRKIKFIYFKEGERRERERDRDS